MNKQMKVPKIRFENFSEQWIKETVGQLFEIKAGGDIDKSHISETQSKSYPYPIYANAKKNKGLYGYSDIYKIEPPCLTVAGRGVNIGIAHARFERFYPIVRLLILKPKSGQDIQFYEYVFNNLNIFVESTGVPQLTAPQISSYTLTTTTLEEQQKIASFLSKVDEKITLLTEKKEKLTEYKKGVMQQLFSGKWEERSGQLTFIPPTLRFKADDGREFPDWEEKALGKIANVYDGTHQTPKYVDEGVPFYSVEHVTANQFSQTKYISEEVYLHECKRVMLEKGDILLTRIGSVGDVKLIDWDVRASFYVSLALVKYNEEVSGLYLSTFMESHFFQSELWKRMIHVAFPKKINLGEIGNCHVCIPSKAEQEKIAGFLSLLNKKIGLAESELKKAKEWKKGLLQQMFV